MQDDLAARGFSVERLDTYNTVPVRALPAADLAAAKAAKVVAFASPSAIKAWLACAGGQDAADVAVACIGKTHIPTPPVEGLACMHACMRITICWLLLLLELEIRGANMQA